MANYNLTQTGDEVQAYIDSIPVIDVTGTLSGSVVVFTTNPYPQVAANYEAGCGSIIRLTVGEDIHLIPITRFDGTAYKGSTMTGWNNVVATIEATSASAIVAISGIDDAPTAGSRNPVTSTGINTSLQNLNNSINGSLQTLQNEIDSIQPIIIEGNVTNAPDEEDITTDSNDLLKFKNRVPGLNQLGYFILRRDQTFAAQVTEANTIYEIRYDFDLDGQTATIPAGSTLKFNGGTINNGEIIVNQYSKIIGGQTTLYNVRIKLKGQGIEISDVNIDIVNAQYGIPYRIAILSETDNVSNLVIKNVNISSSNGGGIKIITDNSTTATRNILIKNCHITHALMGIELQNHTNNQHLIKDVDISNCAFELYTTNSGEYNYGFNISLTGTGNNVNIHDNTFKACAIGVECIGFDDVKINNNSFLRDDTIKTSRPLSFESTKGSSNILINNNYFELGISLVKVTEGTFENNVIIETYKKYSLQFRNCSNIVINNNFVSSSFPTFTTNLESCINCTFSNNILIATAVSQGLRINGNSAYNRVSENSVTLPDNRLAITDETDDTSDTYNLIVNNYQRKASIVWKTKDMVDLYESSVNTDFFKTHLASKTNLWINIYGVMNLTSAVTVPEGYTLNFVGGMVKSESLRSMIGGGEGPVITGAIKSENVNFTGKWRTINGFTIANNKGITDSRPVLSQKDLGFQYFDTTLGKYICWNGTAWINMDGTALA